MPAAPQEHTPGSVFSGAVDTDRAERQWCAYAWPSYGSGELKGDSRFHNRVFYVDQGGEVWQTLNQDRRYAGPKGGPSWDAAMPEDGWGWGWVRPPTDPNVSEYRGRDGNLWKRRN